MVKVIYKNGKKNLLIDGKVYGPYALYYHIMRTLSTYSYYKSSGKWDDERQRKVKSYITRYMQIYEKYYPEEARVNVFAWRETLPINNISTSSFLRHLYHKLYLKQKTQDLCLSGRVLS